MSRDNVTTRLKAGPVEDLTRDLDHGDEVWILVRARASETGTTKDTKDGPIATQQLIHEASWELTDEEADQVLGDRRGQLQLRPDLVGTHPLGLVDDSTVPAGVVDASGVAMTASEFAEARGVPVDQPFVAELLDGRRFLWPDEWEGTGQSMPVIGGQARVPGELESLQVVRILDPGSGDVLAVWSDEDEDRRLLAEEEAALAEERAAEAGAVDEADEPAPGPGGVDRIKVRELLDGKVGEVSKRVVEVESIDMVEALLRVEVEAGKNRAGVVKQLRARLVELGGEG